MSATTQDCSRIITPTIESPTIEPLDIDATYAMIRSLALEDQPVGPVGLEVEGHVVVLDDPTARPDFQLVSAIAAELAELPAGGRTTLEPGGQVEVSSAVGADVGSAIKDVRGDLAVVRSALADAGLGWAFLGAHPLHEPVRVNPADRYVGMEAFFVADPATRAAGAVMMCSTAALQVNLQAGPENEWAERVRRAQRLGPLLTALSGTSAFLAGRDTGWHSARQRAWTGLGRLTSSPLPDTEDPAGVWAERALAAWVIHVPTGAGGLRAADRRRSLADWVADPGDWPEPTEADVRRHLTTLFPPVRLRGWLELRCLDSVPDRWWPVLSALTAAWLDDPAVAAEVDPILPEVGARWNEAARLGLADDALARAAARCLTAALPAVPADLRDDADELRTLALERRSPGTLIADDMRRRGPAAVLEELAR